MRYLVSYKATYLDQREISADNEEHAKSLVEEALSHSHASKYEVTNVDCLARKVKQMERQNEKSWVSATPAPRG
jgi:hypothetical protein